MSVSCQQRTHAPRQLTTFRICRDSLSIAFDSVSRLSFVDCFSRVRVSASSIVSMAFSIASNCFERSLAAWTSCALDAKMLVEAVEKQVSGSEGENSSFLRANNRITFPILHRCGSRQGLHGTTRLD